LSITLSQIMSRLEHTYRHRKFLIAGAILVVFFCLSIAHLFQLRFTAGDVYEPYSSLRADPLGLKILYESLDRFKEKKILRNYRSLSRLTPDTQITLLYSGVSIRTLDYFFYREFNEVDSLVKEGARVVISLIPLKKKPAHFNISKTESEKNDKDNDIKANKDQQEESEKESQKEPPYSLLKKWAFSYDLIQDTEAHKAQSTNILEGLPEDINWHSVIYFTIPEESDWDVIYTFEGKPVIVEKKHGKGTIVLSSDSYFLSNEAMLKSRYPALLSWIVGVQKTIIFDERHLGIQEKRGIAGLARKYHLHGICAGLLLVAALFIWKNSYSFIPPHDDSHGEIQRSADYTERLINLLRRHIPSHKILDYCVQEWESSLAFYDKDIQEKRGAVKNILEEESISASAPHKTYNRILKILSQRK
jgi:hypothetical protein